MDPPRWNEVRDRTPVTLAELDRAAATAEKLLRAVGLRDEAAPTVAEATVVRRKAFALFMRVYARARAAVRYLRAEVGDADDIAPSLYAGRVKHRKRRGEPPQGTPAPSESGNDLAPISPPLEQFGNGSAAPAAERSGATEAADRGGSGGLSGASRGGRAGVTQPFIMLFGGRGPPVGRG